MANRPYPDPIEGLTPGTIIITEETVEVTKHIMDETVGGILNQIAGNKDFIPPVELEVLLNGKPYILKCTHKNKNDRFYYYGDFSDVDVPIFDNNPVALVFDAKTGKRDWTLAVPKPGIYTISAKIPEEKSPKVLSFPKGRTIVSELSRLNKAFGTVSTKKTIIGQLSDIADAAEAGKIGGGSGGALMVHVNGKDTQVLDKTWQEIHDALKTTSVYIIRENEEDMYVGTEHRIVTAQYVNDAYRVFTDNSEKFITSSSDGHPRRDGGK